MAARKYFVLLARPDAASPWGVEFGSFVRDEVDFEHQSTRDLGVRASNLQVIVCGADQAAIDAKVAALNAKAEG